ncbi:DinB family protein [Streptomyces sp. NPDC048603]|uniref:mycothiol transferase n=1 Tax=Streptomyces sp. NPDC048603 TaxID=3365577 RepID=UPI003721A19C
MKATLVLTDGFQRVHDVVHEAVDGLPAEQLNARVGPRANSISWLVWHLTRIQDDHVSELAGRDQAWLAEGFAGRFALPFPPEATGYGHTARQVAEVKPASGEQLLSYFEAVHARTAAYLGTLPAADLDRVIDTRWDPPVTVGVRLVSVLSDDLQHAGQAAFVRGLLASA